MDESSPELELPGFRFHPTEEELLDFYLKNMILGKMIRYDIISFLNIYHYDPQELPGKAKIGEREWYFFVPRDRKHGSGGRPNRTTERGFWKATGSDRKIVSLSEPKRVIGLRKTLVFYKGRAPRGKKTDWVMNEYRFPDNCKLSKDIVLCKVYRKATSMKVLEQRVAMEEDMRNFHTNNNNNNNNNASHTSPMDSGFSLSGPQEEMAQLPGPQEAQTLMDLKQEFEEFEAMRSSSEREVFEDKGSSTTLQLPNGYKEKLPEIQVPTKPAMDWNTQDPLWMQLNSPWLQSLTPYYNNILNFECRPMFS